MNKPEYEMLWRNKWLTSEATSIEDMIEMLQAATDELKDMKESGITLDPEGGTSDDYARLVTTDQEVAEKFGLEIMDDEEDWEDDEMEEEEE